MSQQFRVLHIVQSLNRGGIETMLMNLYRGINRDVIQFDFVVSCLEKSDYEDEVLRLGGRIFRMTPIKILSPHKYLNDLNAFFKKNTNYKIVHSHMNAVSTLPLYIAWKNRVPVRICHSHSNKALGMKRFLKWILKYPLRFLANSYFACSKDAAQYLYGNWFFKGRNCYILKNAINAELYVFNSKIRLQLRNNLNINSKLVVGHVGRFVHVKNHTFILDVFKQIHDKNPDTILLLVGDGEMRQSIERKILMLDIRDSVIITGSVLNVFDYLQVMDLFLFPSLYEGLGMSLIEAQCTGLKCFTTDSISKETAVTDLVEYISLSEKPKVWAERILNTGNVSERKTALMQVKNAGFDVKSSSKWLEDFYLKKNKGF